MTSVLIVLEAALGGIRRHVVDLICGLDPARYQITFVYSPRRADPAFGAGLQQIRARGVRTVELPMVREISPGTDLGAAWRLRRVLRETRPDVIHLHGAKAGAVGRLAAGLSRRAPVVYTPHGGAFHKFSGLGGKIYLWSERLLGWWCPTHYIGVSRDAYAQIERRLGPAPDRVHLVPNGMPSPPSPPASESFASWGPETVNLLYPAVFLPAKGHLEFIAALGRSPAPPDPRIRIWLAGDGPLRPAIEQAIAEARVENTVRLLGFIPDLGPWYRHADLVVVPSRDEAFGYVALEAMHHGCPVLAAPIGGLRELVVPGENGLLLPPNWENDLSGLLNQCVADRRRLQAIGLQGREYARTHFSLQEMVEGTASVYACAIDHWRQRQSASHVKR